MIQSQPWSEQAARGLAVSAGHDLELIREQVQRGRAKLWRCENDNSAAWVVTRIDYETEPEFVIMCFEGSGLHQFAPAFINAARDAGYKIRVHVHRPGMLRMCKRYNLELFEYVLKG